MLSSKIYISTLRKLVRKKKSTIVCNYFSMLRNSNINVQKIRTRNVYENRVNLLTISPIMKHGNKVQVATKSTDNDNHLSLSYSDQEERKAVQKWIDMCRYQGKQLPEKLTEEQFESLIRHHNTYQKKLNYLRYLFRKEMKSEETKLNKLELKKLKEKKKLEKDNKGHISYGLWNNSMFAKVEDSAVVHWHNYNAARAMMYGQPLVIDCGYNSHLNFKESSILSLQLNQVILRNRVNQEPFNLYFCNYDTKSLSHMSLKKNWPHVLASDFPINVTSKSYLNIFPKEKLIYLTPDAKSVMTHFDHDAVYIIGGIVDSTPKDSLSLAKAKMEGLRMMKLPLDRFVTVQKTKFLGIEVVTSILLKIQESGDWHEAMHQIPSYLIAKYEKKPIYKWKRK